jgi:adenosylhomocysteine nucleosidase
MIGGIVLGSGHRSGRGTLLDRPGEPHFVAVTGLAFEARIAAGAGVSVVCAASRLQLKRSVEAALRHPCRGVISFGIAGGLAPHLKAGACIIARSVICDQGRYVSHHGWAQSLRDAVGDAMSSGLPGVFFGDIAGSDVAITSAEVKRSLHESTGAVAVDMESHVAARIAAEHRVPFAAFRVIADPAHRALPPLALVATHPGGTIAMGAVLKSLLRQPAQISNLLRVALDSWAARQTLIPGRRFLGATLCLPDLGEHLRDVA